MYGYWLACYACFVHVKNGNMIVSTISGVMEGLPRGVVKLYTDPPGKCFTG